MKFSTIIALAATIFTGVIAAPITIIANTITTNTNTNTTTSPLIITQRDITTTCTTQAKGLLPTPGTTERYHEIYPLTLWPTFDCLFEINRASINMQNPTPSEADQVKQAVLTAAGQTALDPRVLFAILMQESHGELRVGHTIQPDTSAVQNSGMMQCRGCVGAAQIPRNCPVDQGLVDEMVLGGARFFKGELDRNSGDVFKAMRAYNSGSADWDLNNPFFATGAYVWDCANRLVGWVN
ncbi:hypothetical protein FKW77_005085 [Venturia effusa]|uniref:Transglycosylase SLT domain-containing protein n=1 Tax=Venturia effusa TaxID=50376 RepID=A0A517LCC8_9PEZI|nr:hypothetical protein FKW77_005085 [Venturia effusa]